MYLQNKYTTWYYNIINRAKDRQLNKPVYFERHHIIPKSIGGDNSFENIVKLTAKEHYLCHKLLCQMLPNGPEKRKMVMARFRMTHGNSNNKRHIVSSNEYEKIKTAFAEAQREEKIGKPGILRSTETREKMRLAKLGVKKSDATKQKIRAAALGRKHTAETKEKFKTRVSNRLGTKHREETKIKMSLAKKH